MPIVSAQRCVTFQKEEFCKLSKNLREDNKEGISKYILNITFDNTSGEILNFSGYKSRNLDKIT